MARFNISGTNWEGRKWIASSPVAALAKDIEAFDPTRYPVDGTVASKNHDAANPNSDHRPVPWEGSGIVRAIDIGVENFEQGEQLASAIGKDSRVKYVLWNVPNHRTHIHVSMLKEADTKGQPFDLGRQEVEKIPVPTWAVNAVTWAIANGIYTEDKLEDVRETYDFYRQTVNLYRYHNKFGKQQTGFPYGIVVALDKPVT